MKEDRVKQLLEELKDSVECPIITFPTFDGSDDEEMDNDTLLTPKDCKILLDHITQLETNQEKLKKWLEYKLKQYQKQWIRSTTDLEDRINHERCSIYSRILDEMEELESGNNE